MATVVDAEDCTLTPASGLVGCKVLGSDDKPLGSIAELMVQAHDGTIGYAALAVGGFGGVGERLFAVPWRLFVIDPVDGKLHLPFTCSDLADRKGFDKDSWPTRPDASLAS